MRIGLVAYLLNDAAPHEVAYMMNSTLSNLGSVAAPVGAKTRMVCKPDRTWRRSLHQALWGMALSQHANARADDGRFVRVSGPSHGGRGPMLLGSSGRASRWSSTLILFRQILQDDG